MSFQIAVLGGLCPETKIEIHMEITLKKSYEDRYLMAQSYFRVILGVLGENLTPKELQLLSFIAVRGNILTTTIRNDFMERYNTTQATINNTLAKLKKRKLVIKEPGKIVVNPQIYKGMDSEVKINIGLYGREGTKK